MSSNLTPLEVCEQLIAPIEDLAVIAGYQRKSGYRWRNASQMRDAGDLPPRINRKLLAYSKKNDLGLKAEHLIFGASSADVSQILAARTVAA